MNELAQQRQGLYPVLVTQEVVGNWFHRRQTQKAREVHQQAPGVSAAHCLIGGNSLARWHFIQQPRKGIQESVFIKRLRPPGVAVAGKQIKCEQEGALHESQLGIAIPVCPVELLDTGPEQSGIDGGHAVPGQQPATIAAEDEPALVFANQARQFGHQAGDMQIVKILLPIDATITGVLPIFMLLKVGQCGLAAEIARQVVLGGRFEALLADGVRQ